MASALKGWRDSMDIKHMASDLFKNGDFATINYKVYLILPHLITSLCVQKHEEQSSNILERIVRDLN